MIQRKLIPEVDEEWYEILPVGEFIESSSIIAFKMPLNTEYNNNLDSQDKFHITDLLNEVVKKGKPLKAIINLTKKV